MHFAKIKALYAKPEVRAAVYILLGFAAFFFVIFMGVSFTELTIMVFIFLIIAGFLYMIWATIVEELKNRDERKKWKR